MSNYLTKLRTITGERKASKFSLPCTHIGTTDFFKPSIAYIREVVPGDEFDVKTIVDLRGKPMALPTMGNFKHTLRAFYVPQRVISKDWLSFITGTNFKWDGSWGEHKEDQYIYNSTLVRLFMTTSYGLTRQPESGETRYDITCQWRKYDLEEEKYVYGWVTPEHRMLTNKGRLVYSLLQELGYNINWVLYTDENATNPLITNQNYEYGNELKMSSKKICALVKVIMDYYVPSQWQLDSDYYWDMWKDQKVLSMSDLGHMLDIIDFVCYDMDYFTGAWNTPTGPNAPIGASGGKVWMKDESMNPGHTQINMKNSDGTPYVSSQVAPGQTGNIQTISSYILRALDAVQNYVTRNRIAGYRPIDRFLAHFGIKLDYIQSGRCSYIAGNTTNIIVSDVTSTAEIDDQAGGSAENEQSQLGGVAGKLVGRNGLNFKWKCEEHGYIIILQTIIPSVGYVQGVNRENLRLKVTDFYHGEFDTLGCDAIARGELWNSNNGLQCNEDKDNPNAIWGYGVRYMPYKVGHDVLSGDFRVESLNTGMECMHLFRTWAEHDYDGEQEEVPTQISYNFLKGDNEQYDRIFMYDKGDVDHVYFCANTGVTAIRPMETISEGLPLEGDQEGKSVEFDYGGSYMQ